MTDNTLEKWQNNWVGTLQKQVSKCQVNIGKGTWLHKSLWKCKFKLQWDTTTPAIRITKTVKMDNSEWGCKATRALVYLHWEHELVRLLWKAAWQKPLKLNMWIPDDPAFSLLGWSWTEMPMCGHRKISKNVHNSVACYGPPTEKEARPPIFFEDRTCELKVKHGEQGKIPASSF